MTKSKTQQQINVLAGKTSECPCLEIDTTKQIPKVVMQCRPECQCKGTGLLPVFQSLRKHCFGYPPIEVIEALTMSKCEGERCKFCRGKAWVPVMVGEVDLNKLLMEAGKLLADDLRLIDLSVGAVSYCKIFEFRDGAGHVELEAMTKSSPSPTEAVIAALFEAVSP